MLQVCAPRITENQYVIEEHKNEYPDEVLQDVVQECLERCRHIGEAERHHKKLEVAVMHLEHHLLDVGQVHEHLVVPAAEVKLGEEAGATEFIKQYIHHVNQEHVTDRLGVERMIIDAEPPGFIWFLDERATRM
jgi:hypothetical protein